MMSFSLKLLYWMLTFLLKKALYISVYYILFYIQIATLTLKSCYWVKQGFLEHLYWDTIPVGL